MPVLRSLSPIFAVFALVACTTAAPPASAEQRRSIAVAVGASGYTPSEVTAAAGEEVRLVFTRTSDEGCGQQLVFPEMHIHRDLPLDEPVPVDITMPASGTVAFTCGMGMYRGALVVR
jgi:plastocyanin domain-containing protein